jgi:2-polyprenyl-3-methyl-5-hydroxy-6-metoxy-1,4-benzoquinol methylase
MTPTMSFLSNIAERRLQPELMDDPEIDHNQHHLALRGLSRINFCSNTSRTLWQPLCRLQQEIGAAVRVLDLACGGGDVICGLARISRHFGLPFEFAGCDKSVTAVEYAKQNALRVEANIEFFAADVLQDVLPVGFDVVMCSLFLHHLTELKSVVLLRKMSDAASRLVLINDLLRTRKGLMLAQVATRVLSSSPVVRYDGPRSVEGAYTCIEVEQLATLAGLKDATITPCWPERFLFTWRKPS